MQTKPTLKENLLLFAGIGSLGLALYYVFIKPKKNKTAKQRKPLKLDGIPTTNLEDFQFSIFGVQLNEENGRLPTQGLIEIFQFIGTFLLPFLQAECYSARQSRRKYMDDMPKYLEAVELHHNLVGEVWIETVAYVESLRNIRTGRLALESQTLAMEENEFFGVFYANFPTPFEMSFPPQKSIKRDRELFMQIHRDMIKITAAEAESLMNYTHLFGRLSHGAILWMRTLDRAYLQYGYEIEEMFKLVPPFEDKNADMECKEVMDLFNAAWADASDKVLLKRQGMN